MSTMVDDTDKNTDNNESKSVSNDNDKTSSAQSGPMSLISGVRRLQQSNSVVGIVPRFGIDLADEQPVAEVCQYVDMWFFIIFQHKIFT